MSNKCLNLEGKTDAVSLDELFELRKYFEIAVDVAKISPWLDSSIQGDGFEICFEFNQKVWSLSGQYLHDAK